LAKHRSDPTFLGIGAQKAGTSWLHYQLRRHPDVWMPPEKELHYFDRSPQYPSPSNLATSSPFARLRGSEPWERPQMQEGARRLMTAVRERDPKRARWVMRRYFGYYGDEWYRRLFRPAGSASATGEITPSYSMLEPDDVAWIHRVNPEMRLIFLIRHPVDRAWSAIRFFIEKGRPDAAKEPPERIIQRLRWRNMARRGDYERTLEVYLEHFDRHQVLVGFYDAITADPTGLLDGVTDFLGIARFDHTTLDTGVRINASVPAEMPPEVRDYLVETYEPMIERLAKRFGGYAERWRDPDGATTTRDSALLPAIVYP
jgi:hypothetical protein